MGYLRPTAVIVTGLYEDPESGVHWAEIAHAKALHVFARPWRPMEPRDMTGMVSPLSGDLWNNARSFVVHWDGSKEGWFPSTAADEARAEFVQWLREQAFEDGSSPLRWVEVAYADDDGTTMVLATSADARNALKGREDRITLQIEDPLRSALEWAELDGIEIRDPVGWRVGVFEMRGCEAPLDLGPWPLTDPIGRGEYERRLEVSTVRALRSYGEPQ